MPKEKVKIEFKADKVNKLALTKSKVFSEKAKPKPVKRSASPEPESSKAKPKRKRIMPPKEKEKDPDTAPVLFYGKDHYLSNFYAAPFTIADVEYATVEHFFQAMKFLDAKYRDRVISAATPASAKRLGRGGSLRPDWEEIKIGIMKQALQAKFDQNPTAKKYLISTKGRDLIEDSRTDKFWGRGKKGDGKNILGKLLEEIRAEYLNE